MKSPSMRPGPQQSEKGVRTVHIPGGSIRGGDLALEPVHRANTETDQLGGLDDAGSAGKHGASSRELFLRWAERRSAIASIAPSTTFSFPQRSAPKSPLSP